MYVRLYFVVEGQTEERFVKQTLSPYLSSFNVGAIGMVVTTSRRRGKRGGLSKYERVQNDIIRLTKQEKNLDVRFTTMFDLYGLPDDFPGYEAAALQDDPYQRVQALEDALADDIDDHRFIPYIQLHEFEALLLSDPGKLGSEFIGSADGIARLATMVARFRSPEHVNDGSNTAPSKRLIRAIPEYEGRKASAGPIVADKIGLPTLRSKCAHFADWLAKLENLGK